MAESPYLRQKYRGSGPIWFLYASLWCGIPLCCCLGLWWAKGRDTRPEQPELIERFHQNRADFDNFIPFYRQLEPGERHTFPASFDVRGPEREESHYPHVTTDGDCVLLRWRWGRPLNRDEYLIHSPRGLAGIPSKYRESAWGDGALKYRITPIDDTWFYMLEP